MKNYEHSINELRKNNREQKKQIQELKSQLKLAISLIKELKCN